MGRYTSVQVVSDQNNKIINDKIASASAISSQNNRIEEKEVKKRLVVEKVHNVTGSTAGANSGEFDVYRATRRRELNRLNGIELEQKAAAEAREYAAKIARNKEEADARTAKNALRRNKKKQKKIELKRKYDEMVSEQSQHQEDASNSESTVTTSDVAK